MKKIQKYNRGYMLIQVIVFGSIAVYILSALVGWASLNVKAGGTGIQSREGFANC